LLTAADGGVFTFGNAQYKAGPRSCARLEDLRHLGTPSGQGYWQIAGPTVRAHLSPGDSGQAVTQLQNQLIAQGYWLGPVNGSYGTLTTQAVMAFQKVNGLPRTGVFRPRDPYRLRHRDAAPPPGPRATALEVDKARQVLFEVRNGSVVWIWNTSTGTEGPYTYAGVKYVAHTPEGTFKVGITIDACSTAGSERCTPRFFTVTGSRCTVPRRSCVPGLARFASG